MRGHTRSGLGGGGPAGSEAARPGLRGLSTAQESDLAGHSHCRSWVCQDDKTEGGRYRQDRRRTQACARWCHQRTRPGRDRNCAGHEWMATAVLGYDNHQVQQGWGQAGGQSRRCPEDADALPATASPSSTVTIRTVRRRNIMRSFQYYLSSLTGIVTPLKPRLKPAGPGRFQAGTRNPAQTRRFPCAEPLPASLHRRSRRAQAPGHKTRAGSISHYEAAGSW